MSSLARKSKTKSKSKSMSRGASSSSSDDDAAVAPSAPTTSSYTESAPGPYCEAAAPCKAAAAMPVSEAPAAPEPETSGPTVTVIVKAPSGRAAPVTLPASASTAELRRRAAAAAGVPLARAQLVKGGKVIEPASDMTVSDACISNECTITVREAEPAPAGPNFEVMVKMSTGECFPISINANDDVATLRSRIASHASIACVRVSQVSAKFQGKDLTDGNLCGDVGLGKECVVKVQVLDPAAAAAAAAAAPGAEVSEEKRQEVLNSFAESAAGKPIDILFCFDTTGSMYSCLQQVRDNVKQSCERLIKEIKDIRIAIMGIGDFCDACSTYVTEHIDFSDDAAKLSKFALQVRGTGGGDTPEAYEWGLRVAQELSWREESSKALVMIGDCQPHPPSYTTERVFWKDEVDKLAARGVKIYGVHALNNLEFKDFYEEMARRSGGVYINFVNFSLITDMFLAVCYREANKEKLEAYKEEVKQDGRMNEAMTQMIEELEKPNMEKKVAKEDRPTKPWDWWDPRNDHGSPQYSLKDGKWVNYSSGSRQTVDAMYVDAPARSPRTHTGSTSRRTCNVM
eukprot:m51a1_g1314 putative von willebrand factor type a (571) ;mRNA; r:221805-223707